MTILGFNEPGKSTVLLLAICFGISTTAACLSSFPDIKLILPDRAGAGDGLSNKLDPIKAADE